MNTIGKIVATEKNPTTIDDFSFWTQKDMTLKPFDVVVVNHIHESNTYGVIEEISHITDSPSYLAGYISSDFGDVEHTTYTDRIGMNLVKCRVVGNTANIYTPVLDGATVSLASEKQIKEALGLNNVENPLPAGYIEMYEGENKQTIPVHFNSQFLIGPNGGAHLNISGISGLASKTSYAMFLMKAIQDNFADSEGNDSVAFIMLNVKGTDLLSIDEPNTIQEDLAEIYPIYDILNISKQPFNNVKYLFPYSKDISPTTYAKKEYVSGLMETGRAYQYKYIYEEDKESIDLLFANIDDPSETMESITSYIYGAHGEFSGVTNWEDLKTAIHKQTQKGGTNTGKEITIQSWRKFERLFNKAYEKNKSLFANRCCKKNGEIRIKEQILNIKKNDVLVVDIAKLDEETQGFVFGDVMKAIYDLKLIGVEGREDYDIPSKIIVFVDELNKYASNDIPKSSPILKNLLEITERGRSLGIILFGAEQFISDIHKRIKGNCATFAYGRTNVIEISKGDFQFISPVYKSMLTRLKQGEYILQNPAFRSLLNVKFPKPIYKYK